MAAKRHYESATVFGARIVNMKHLWTPSTEFAGKPTQKPNYFATFIAPKTKSHWSEEPVFAGLMGAYNKLVQQAGMQLQHVTSWPIKDGDVPEPGKDVAEWARGQWVFSGSTGNLPNVEVVQNGTPVKLAQRAIVKPGDFAAVGLTAAFKMNDVRGIKHYLSTVLFTGQGEEIVFSDFGVSGDEMLQQAQQQGMNVTGFSGSFAGNGAPVSAAPQALPSTAFGGSGGVATSTPPNPFAGR